MPEPLRVHCHQCSGSEDFEGPVPRSALCGGCGRELRCCRNCGFYDSSAYNDCSEPTADRVVDKEAANFCDHFKPGTSGGGASRSGAGTLGELEDLFKK